MTPELIQIAIVVGIIYAVVLIFLPFKLWGAADNIRKQRECQERQEALLRRVVLNLDRHTELMDNEANPNKDT